MTDEEEREDDARRTAFLLDAARELVDALAAEDSRDPGDEVAEALTLVRLQAARVKLEGVVEYLDRRRHRAG